MNGSNSKIKHIRATFGGSDKSLPISARLLPVKCVGFGSFLSSELSSVFFVQRSFLPFLVSFSTRCELVRE